MSFLSMQVMSPSGKFSIRTIEPLHELHLYNGCLIVVLATGHALAACFHYFILRDNVLRRMFITGNISDERDR